MEDSSSSTPPAEPLTPQRIETKGDSLVNNEKTNGALEIAGPAVVPCVGDYAATYNRASGRIYASTKAILFYSNLFGFEKRLCLMLSDIEEIQSYRSTSIKVSMVDCEDYVFKKFENRDAVLGVLEELLTKASCGRKIRVKTCRSISSSPLSIDCLPDGRNDDFSLYGSNEMTRSRQSSTSTQPELSEDSSLGAIRHRSQSDTQLQQLYRPPRLSPLEENLSPLRKSPQKSILIDPTKTRSNFHDETNIPVNLDMEKEWEGAKEHYEELALEAITLPCSLDTFMETFVANEAIYPISKYQKEVIGDKEVNYSMWKIRPLSQPPIFDRDVSFLHPLNKAVGPSQAETTRQQCFQKFGDLGLCLQNSTVVGGIPAADCFRVEDRWTIERMATNEEEVKMAVSFRIVFSKRTILKPIIQKRIRQETRDWFRGYARMVKEALTDTDEKRQPLSEELLSESFGSNFNKCTVSTSGGLSGWSYSVCIGLSVVTIVGFVLHYFSMQQSFNSLQNRMDQMQSQNEELAQAIKELLARQC